MSTQHIQTKTASQSSLTPAQTGLLQRKCACGQHTVAGTECEECRQKREGMLQRAAVNAAPSNAVPPIVHEVLSSPGQALDAGTRVFMEPRFGHDFSQVRVHTDARAAESARAVNALAYTVGRDIVFGEGEYEPGTAEGRSMLAHELTHVVQQSGGVGLQPKLRVGPTDDHYEQEADQVSNQVMQGSTVSELLPATTRYIQRQPAKHNLTATRFIGNAVLEDVYDGKRLLQNADSGDAVRLIQESLIAQGFALPVFGADGKFGSETEKAVRAFQVATGAKKIDGIVGQETMQLLNMHDPGGTTATGLSPAGAPVMGPVRPPATAAVFSELPEEKNAGYDDSLAPNWLFVPVNGRREVKVAVTPAIASPSFVSLNPAVATVTTTPLGIEVTGVANGTADIQAKQGATILATLKVRAKSRRDLTVDYHFMRDSAVPPHHTTRPVSQAPKLSATLNRIWERQANVRFTTGTVNSPAVPGDLGTVVLWNAAPALDEWHLVTAFATGGNYNVFLVWEFEEDATPDVDDANAGTITPNTLLEDNECPDALTIAHEAGHFLGIDPHTPSGIMSACGGADRERVRKAQADVVNP